MSKRFAIACALFVLVLAGCAKAPSRFEQPIFVWQRAWSPELKSALQRSAPEADAYWVLVAQGKNLGGKLGVEYVPVDWAALSETRVPVVAVLRAEPEVTRFLKGNAAETFCTAFQQVSKLAAENNVVLQGVQLDFDCPTAELPAYAAVLKKTTCLMPDASLGITVLPTWLSSDEFRALIKAVGYGVLQLHGLEMPRTREDKAILCDMEKGREYVRQFTQYKKPFYVALPTYTDVILFDRAGAVAGVGGENLRNTAKAAGGSKPMAANPISLAETVRQLRSAPPPHCRGIAWFRLPVDTDRLNWPWPILRRVMAGERPQLDCRAEVRHPREGLCEIWLVPSPPMPPGLSVRVKLVTDAPIRASDMLAGFKQDGDGSGGSDIILTGPLPLTEPRLAAWFDYKPDSEAKVSGITIVNLEIVE